jgi:quinol monooxygenase YgiN/Mg-chelatase subunit ChlD
VGIHNPAQVLREDYSADDFTDGPLLEAMKSGGFLYLEELKQRSRRHFHRLLTGMADRSITMLRAGTVTARPTFRVIGATRNSGATLKPLRRKPKQLTEEPELLDVTSSKGGAAGLAASGDRRVKGLERKGTGSGAAFTDEEGVLAGTGEGVDPDPETLRRAREIAARLAVPRPKRDRLARRGAGTLATVPYRGGSSDIDLDRTLERLLETPVPEDTDILVREPVRTRRSVALLVDVSGSMRGERVRTAAAAVGALAAELDGDDLAVIAFWSDAAVLSHLGQRVSPRRIVESMVRIPARGLTNVAFPLQVARRELARVPARDARVLLLSDCVHNAGPDPRPLAARLPRLEVLLDTTGEQDPELARDLARLGRGRLRSIRTYRDVAPALSQIFASLARFISVRSVSEETPVSIIIVATVFPKPEYRDEIIAAFEKAEETVHATEDGCLLYALHEGPDGRLVMIEKYTDQAAVDAHLTSAGFAALMAGLDGKMASPLDAQILAPHPAGSPDKGAL